MIVSVDDGAEAKIYNNGTIAALTENVGDEYHDILRAARCIYEYCSVYEKAAPLKAEGLSGNYRCLSEFNGTVLAAKYNEEYGLNLSLGAEPMTEKRFVRAIITQIMLRQKRTSRCGRGW